jgi:hypothetical protein
MPRRQLQTRRAPQRHGCKRVSRGFGGTRQGSQRGHTTGRHDGQRAAAIDQLPERRGVGTGLKDPDRSAIIAGSHVGLQSVRRDSSSGR